MYLYGLMDGFPGPRPRIDYRGFSREDSADYNCRRNDPLRGAPAEK